jgi:hypothetical protein
MIHAQRANLEKRLHIAEVSLTSAIPSTATSQDKSGGTTVTAGAPGIKRLPNKFSWSRKSGNNIDNTVIAESCTVVVFLLFIYVK